MFQILSAQEFQRLAKRQKEAIRLAAKRQEEKLKRMEIEQEKAAIRQQQTARRIEEQMAVFNKNQSMLLNQVNMYVSQS